MSLFWRLYLAHLLADFPFQTNRIFAWKTRNFAGVLVHVSFVIAFSTLMMGPLLTQPEHWILVSALGFAHALQDHFKVLYSKSSGNDGLAIYLADQGGHLVATIIGVLVFRPWTMAAMNLGPEWGWLAEFYNSDRYVVVSCLLIALTYGVDIGRHLLQRPRGPLVRDWYGMGERATLVLTGAAALYTPWALALIAAWLFIRLNRWSQLKSQGLLTAVLSLATGWLVPFLGA